MGIGPRIAFRPGSGSRSVSLYVCAFHSSIRTSMRPSIRPSVRMNYMQLSFLYRFVGTLEEEGERRLIEAKP